PTQGSAPTPYAPVRCWVFRVRRYHVPATVRKERVMAGLRLGVASVASVFLWAASAGAADTPAAPTFTKDVAPIFQAKCEACHRPDSMAPMSLVSYQDARPWARSIKARVAAR